MKKRLALLILFCAIALPALAELTEADLDKIRLLVNEELKPVKADGVFEIRADYRTDTYRAVYAVKIGERVYVLHCFQKKARSGIKTSKKDVDLIKRCLGMAQELEKNYEQED